MNAKRFTYLSVSVFVGLGLLAMVVFFLSLQTSQAKTEILSPIGGVIRYISTSGDDTGNDCTNSNNPCQTVQHGINMAQGGDSIQVSEGIYTGTTIVSLDAGPFTATIIITKNITLQGGFNTAFTENNPQTYVTTLDGENQRGSVVGFLGSHASIDGFSIINGSSPSGGGIFAGDWVGTPAVITVSNNIVANNHTITDTAYAGDGAGILITLGTVANIHSNQILSNTIETNDGYGAGLSVRFGATAIISGNLVAYNRSHPSTVAGGINVYTATVQIINNIFQENSRSGIDIYDSPSALVMNNTIISNTTDGDGGGILVGESVVTITGNLVAYNIANNQLGGGIFIHSNAHALIENNQIVSNTANIGGGISMYGGASGTIQNNIVAYNHSGDVSGGIEIRECGQVTVTNNTVFANEAGSAGGGILVVSNLEPTVITYNKVYSNTSNDGGAGIHIQSSPAFIDSNTVYDNTALGWGTGIGVFGYYSHPITMTNNVVVSNDSNGIWAVDSTQALIINNTVADNLYEGISGWGWPITPTYSIQTIIINNIVVNNGTCGINGFNGADLQIDNNDIFGNQFDFCGLALPDSNNISADPLFIDPVASDYHIQDGSPAMNTGTNQGAPLFDIEGTPRPQMGIVDMGAYEVKQPELNINYTTGQPGSFFSITGLNFPNTIVDALNAEATIDVNGTILGTVQIDPSGSLLFVLDTALADEGQYVITVSSGNVSETVEFVLDADEPLHLQEDTAPSFDVPEGIANPIDHNIYLPVVVK